MPRDSQRSKCYSWERKLEDIHEVRPAILKLDLDSCRLLTEAVWLEMTGGHEYSEGDWTKPPIVKAAHGRRQASCYAGFPRRIELTTWGLNIYTVLHETAHAVISVAEWQNKPLKFLPSHGPHFVTLAMRIYERYLGFNRIVMEETAALKGLKFVSDTELDKFLDRGLDSPPSL